MRIQSDFRKVNPKRNEGEPKRTLFNGIKIVAEMRLLRIKTSESGHIPLKHVQKCPVHV